MKPISRILAALLGQQAPGKLQHSHILHDQYPGRQFLFQTEDRFIIPGNPVAGVYDPGQDQITLLRNRYADGHEAIAPTSGGGGSPYTYAGTLAGYTGGDVQDHVLPDGTDPGRETLPFRYIPNPGAFFGQCVGCQASDTQGPASTATYQPSDAAGGNLENSTGMDTFSLPPGGNLNSTLPDTASYGSGGGNDPTLTGTGTGSGGTGQGGCTIIGYTPAGLGICQATTPTGG